MIKHSSSLLPFHRLLLATTLVMTPWVVKAQTTYRGDILTTANWSSQTWTPSGVPGTTNGSSSTDYVRIDKTTSGAAELRLTENRNVASLTRFRALDSTGGSIRLVNNAGNNNIKLTIQDSFSVESGYLYLRAHHSYTARFTVETDRMEVGATQWNGATPAGAGIGTVYFSGHSGSNDYSRVTLKVNETFTVIGNGRFIYDGSATGLSEIDLGDVVFRDSIYNGTAATAPTFLLGTAISEEVDHRVKLRSLSSEAANSSGVSVTGGATIELYGDEATEPTDYRFYGEIKETTRLEKTGGNTQTLSRSAGNSYSGGTLIAGGTLVVENTTGSGLGSGSVTISGSGTLGGNGRIALAADEVITVQSGGTLAPGKNGESFNTLRIEAPSGSNPALSMEEGSRFLFTIGAGNASDKIEFLNYTTGALALSAGGIEISLDGDLSEGVYQLFVFREGGDGSALVSSGFSNGFYVNNPSGDFNITLHYNEAAFGGAGVIAMEVTAIPEPASVVLLVVGVGFLGLQRVRRASRVF